ncbi:DUF2635 domain-containing protein [Pseudomonas helleri]|uniref:DUF2635 domain-containing protein n=1 Tax=Pseudomonas helleri TaxID=1608996 RepID=A0A7X2CIB6_9PSED|nr:DUF2635 domain-containing protein [Pseudomonas helleri]MQT96571.1 DUF2635 domain-containing protein [Pseudomonas helleri]MQU31821.1 DUF2635 domain-containing protein [Pseudomonas helleri]
MTRLHVKPAEGRAAPDPDNNYALLPAEGGLVPDNAYWQRRLKDQDVIMIEAPDEPAPVVVTTKGVRGAKANEL